jgi:hypothetical protein
MRRASKLKNGRNYRDNVEIKYTENSFLRIKASESWSIEWAVKTAAPAESQ